MVLTKSSKSLSITIGKERKLKVSTAISQAKARLQQMEQETAAKLEELRRRASKDSRMTKLMNQGPVKSVASSITSQKPGLTVHSQKRERRHSIRSKMLPAQVVSSSKCVDEKVNSTPKNRSGSVDVDTVDSLFLAENQAAIKHCHVRASHY